MRIPDRPSSAALVPVGTRMTYLESPAHYQTVARRALAALSNSGGCFVLLMGNPPPDPRALHNSLCKMVEPSCAVVGISCGPKLKRDDLVRMIPARSGQREAPDRSSFASSLFVFDDIDRLSDGQIADICGAMLCDDQSKREAVLLASLDFAVRLDQPALRCLKERTAAQIRFEEVCDDETVAYLHNQLLVQRDRRAEARGFRYGISIGLAAGGVAIAASIGVFLLHPTAAQVCEAPARSKYSSLMSKGPSVLRPAAETPTIGVPEPAVLNAEMTSAIATTPALSASAPTTADEPHHRAETSAAAPPIGPRLSSAEIDVLLARGDFFLPRATSPRHGPFTYAPRTRAVDRRPCSWERPSIRSFAAASA